MTTTRNEPGMTSSSSPGFKRAHTFPCWRNLGRGVVKNGNVIHLPPPLHNLRSRNLVKKLPLVESLPLTSLAAGYSPRPPTPTFPPKGGGSGPAAPFLSPPPFGGGLGSGAPVSVSWSPYPPPDPPPQGGREEGGPSPLVVVGGRQIPPAGLPRRRSKKSLRRCQVFGQCAITLSDLALTAFGWGARRPGGGVLARAGVAEREQIGSTDSDLPTKDRRGHAFFPQSVSEMNPNGSAFPF